MAEELVLTPGGPRPPSLVHQVEEGQVLRALNRVVHRMAAADSVSFVSDSPRFSALSDIRLQYEATAALGSGWIAYAYWSNPYPMPIASFTTSWIVPSAPATQSGQTIFLFNGIQNVGNNYGILQPVLQWGSSAAGGGAYWSVANWYVTSGGQAFYTPLVQVDVGDNLTGVMTLTDISGGNYSYQSAFEGIGTPLSIDNIAQLVWANETLEAYSVQECSDYPAVGGTAFAGIEIQLSDSSIPPLTWTAVNAVTDCGQGVANINNANPGGEVDIQYS